MSSVSERLRGQANPDEMAQQLDRQAGRQPGAPLDRDSRRIKFKIDTSKDADIYDTPETWPIGKYLVKITDGELGTVQGQNAKNPGADKIVLEFTVIGGPLEGKSRRDHFMVEGRGKIKTLLMAEALGLYDRETKETSFDEVEDFIGKTLWIQIVHEKAYKKDGTEYDKGVIPMFDGFFPEDAFELPEPGDIFADPGQAEPVQSAQRADPPVTTPPVATETGGSDKPKW